MLTKHLTAEPDAPSMRAPKAGLDPQVDAIVKKALAKDPSARFQSAAALAEQLEEIYSDTVGNATGPGSRSQRNRVFAVPAEDESDVRLRRSDIDAFERGYLTELLRTHRGNLAQAARAAGMDRKNLWALVERHGLDRTTFKKP